MQESVFVFTLRFVSDCYCSTGISANLFEANDADAELWTHHSVRIFNSLMSFTSPAGNASASGNK